MTPQLLDATIVALYLAEHELLPCTDAPADVTLTSPGAEYAVSVITELGYNVSSLDSPAAACLMADLRRRHQQQT